jgi:hypothetical protein
VSTNKINIDKNTKLEAQIKSDKAALEALMRNMGERGASITELTQFIIDYKKLLDKTTKLSKMYSNPNFDAEYQGALQKQEELRTTLWNIIQENVSNNKITDEDIPQFVSITLGINAKLLESATTSESSATLNAAARNLANSMRILIAELRAGNATNDELTAVGAAAEKVMQPGFTSGSPSKEMFGGATTETISTTTKNRSSSEKSKESVQLGHTVPSTPRRVPGMAPAGFSQPKSKGSLGAQSKKTAVMQNALSQAGVGGIYVPPASHTQPVTGDTPDESRAAQIRLEKIKSKWEELEWQEKKSNIVNMYAGGQAKDPDTINAIAIAACQQKLARLENTYMKETKRPDSEEYMKSRVAKIAIYGEGAWGAKPAKSSDGQENKNVLDVFHEGTKIFEVRPGENKIQFCIPNPTAEQRVVAIEMFQEMCGIKGLPAKVRIGCENNEAMKQLLAKDVANAGIEQTNIQKPSFRPTND